jgi:uncharacterized protein
MFVFRKKKLPIHLPPTLRLEVGDFSVNMLNAMHIFSTCYAIYKRMTQKRRNPFMSALQRIALFLTIIGAINWGLIGFFQFDLVAAIFGGQDSWLARVIYSLIGIAGLINLALLFKPAEELGRTEPKASRT